MTYEEFKKQLYRTITFLGISKYKEIVLFEKRKNIFDKKCVELIKEINYNKYGVRNILIREDLLCVLWYEKGERKYKCWPVQELYLRYLRAGWSDMLSAIIFKIQYDPYERIRERLIVKPINRMNHTEELQNHVFWNVSEDLALVLYDVFQEDAKEAFMVKITEEKADKWGVSRKEILWDALLNTKRKMPPRLFHGGKPKEIAWDEEGGFFMPEEGEQGIRINGQDREEKRNGYCLTTSAGSYGAVALFYPGVKERIGALLGCDYYVGFFQMNHVMIHPAVNHITETMRKKIQIANAIIDQRYVLSSEIFRYNVARRNLMEI